MELGEADFLSRDEVARGQRSRWTAQRRHVTENSTFYEKLWNGRGAPERLEDLPGYPFTTKAMLRESQTRCPPFGDYLATPVEKINRIHRTSGTTGRAVTMALSEDDSILNARIGGRAFRTCGLGPGHVAVHCLNFQLWMGGLSDNLTLEASGCATVPFGVGSSELLIRTMLDLNVTAIHCTPSYPAILEQVVAERFPDLSPRDLGLEIGVLVGEPGLENPAFRERIEDTWGFVGRNAYGMSECWSTMAGQCPHSEDMHFVALDVLHHELIDPDSGDTLPWRTGTTGELVLTHLTKDCQPLVRFRTHDILEITGTSRCACGRTAPRFRVLGRSDDMVVVRGINVFPPAVAIVLNRFPELSGEFQIELAGSPPYDRLPVTVELAQGQAPSPGLKTAIENAIKDQTGASATVSLFPPLGLPRTDGKAKRVWRRDEDRE